MKKRSARHARVIDRIEPRVAADGRSFTHRVSRNVNQEEEARLTMAESARDKLAEFGGSWKFIITFVDVPSIVDGLEYLAFRDPYFDPSAILTIEHSLEHGRGFTGADHY